MLGFLQTLGARGLAVLQGVGRAGLLWWHSIIVWPDLRRSFPLLVKQLHQVGVRSVFIIVIAGAFMGMVLGLQGYNTLIRFGAEEALGQVVALILVRELGPVVTALLFAGRAGSALAAEIALMKTTEQLSALRVMGVDPLHYVLAPRLWAGTIAMPLLAAVFVLVAIYGAELVGVAWLGLHEGTYWSNMQDSVELVDDVMAGILKALVFGFTVTWVAVYQGYEAERTAAGMANAATHTVVYSSLLVLGLDFVLTMVLF